MLRPALVKKCTCRLYTLLRVIKNVIFTVCLNHHDNAFLFSGPICLNHHDNAFLFSGPIFFASLFLLKYPLFMCGDQTRSTTLLPEIF